MERITLRCYGDLAGLAGADRDGLAEVPVGDPRSIKDAVESVGIPHTEVDLVVVDGESVGWDEHVSGGERVAVYPPFETLPAGVLSRVRPAPPPRPLRFVADVHLGTLARRLRLLGFDTWYDTEARDDDLAARSVADERILLTRDRGLLMRAVVRHGALLRSTDPREQLTEVIRRFGLERDAAPMTRCVACNGALTPVAREEVLDELEPGTRAAGYDEFARCGACGKLYWRGAHHQDLDTIVSEALDERAR